ncbi:MAG: hypothetical protein GY754_26580 [bacterium]|nr:hypothetical protein [bacterium]
MTGTGKSQITIDDIVIKKIGREYNSEMLDLIKNSPMAAKDIDLVVDRRPDCFLMPELNFDEVKYGGFFYRDRLEGFVMFGFKTVYVNGKPEVVFCYSDLHFSKKIQGYGLYPLLHYKFYDFYYDEVVKRTNFGYSAILQGNVKVEKMIGEIRKESPYVPYSKRVAEMTTKSMLITFAKKESTKYSIRIAEKKDIPGIVALLDEEFKNRLLGPVITKEKFLKNLEDRPGFGIENYYIAEYEDTIVGVCSAWDSSSVKQTVPTRHNFKMKLIASAYSIAGKLFKFPALPKIGVPFKEVYIAEYAIRNRDPEIMKALLTRVYTVYKEKKYNSVLFMSSSDDPLLKAADDFFGVTIKAGLNLYYMTRERFDRDDIAVNLPYLDIALL